MKRLLSLFTVLFVSIVSLANDFNIVEPLDTNSYVKGFQFTGWAVMDDNGLLRDENDYKEYIRGLEETIKTFVDCDSSYMMSYVGGATNGVFLTDSYMRRKETVDYFRYIVDGLRKVAEDKIVLPADTIEAYTVLNRTAEYKNIYEVDDSIKREIFTAIGIVEPFRPGLQEDINSFSDTKFTFNRHAYASGMADVFANIMIGKPKSAYELGKTYASNVNISLLCDENFDKASFIAGAKAALNIGKQLIDKAYMEGLADMVDKDAIGNRFEKEDDDRFEKLKEIISQLEVELSDKFAVDWNVTAQNVADRSSAVADSFGELMTKTGLDTNDKMNVFDDYLMATVTDADDELYDSVSAAIKAIPLKKGYEWFCAKDFENELTVGIKESKITFNAKVVEASVVLNNSLESIFIQFCFDSKYRTTWTKFTRKNIGNPIVTEINGIFVGAPRIVCEITTEECLVTIHTLETVNRLFKGAELIKPADYPIDVIEVIEEK